MRFILPTLKAIITIYLEYLGIGPLTQLANYQSNGFVINVIVVCNRHILFLSFLYNLHTLRIGESRCATGLAPDATTGEKSLHNPTYGVSISLEITSNSILLFVPKRYDFSDLFMTFQKV